MTWLSRDDAYYEKRRAGRDIEERLGRHSYADTGAALKIALCHDFTTLAHAAMFSGARQGQLVNLMCTGEAELPYNLYTALRTHLAHSVKP